MGEPVTLTIKVESQTGYYQYWSYETDKGLGSHDFGEYLTLEDIRSLRIAPEADDCYISIWMGVGSDSDIVDGVSGDFQGVTFNNWGYDAREGDLSGEIFVQQENIPFEIVERLG